MLQVTQQEASYAMAATRTTDPVQASAAAEPNAPDGTFFISYNGQDVRWAEWIAWTIEDLGFQVSIQAWDFLPGNSWAHEMHRRLSQCKALILVLSPDSMKSGFVEAE